MVRRSKKGLAFAALDFTCCVALWAIVQLSPPPPPVSAIKTYGEYAVILTWPRDCGADLDLYVRQPDGEIIFFNHENGTVVHLEHDDIPSLRLGYEDQPNSERAVLRRLGPGEYVVNVHVYQASDCVMPARAQIELWRLRGQDERVATARLRMRDSGDEQTAFRFSLRRDGNLYGINRLPRELVGP